MRYFLVNGKRPAALKPLTAMLGLEVIFSHALRNTLGNIVFVTKKPGWSTLYARSAMYHSAFNARNRETSQGCNR